MKSYSPTTPSRRHTTSVDYTVLSRTKPFRKLMTKLPARAGRNNQGRITVRHQGGGNKKLYRVVDFQQQTLNVPAKIESIEYDPYRSAFVARCAYRNGKRSYILAPFGLNVGDTIVISEKAPLSVGNRMRLQNIPVGYQVHNIEMQPNRGGRLAKVAGSYAEVLAHDNGYTTLKVPSREIRRVSWDCFASVGQVSNPDWRLAVIGKAGRSRGMGIRPTVRGTAMNPVDHPYGGGEGRQPRGTRRPKTAWGKITGGRRTRNKKKWSNVLIVKRRQR